MTSSADHFTAAASMLDLFGSDAAIRAAMREPDPQKRKQEAGSTTAEAEEIKEG
jgi:hypothetical protein